MANETSSCKDVTATVFTELTPEYAHEMNQNGQLSLALWKKFNAVAASPCLEGLDSDTKDFFEDEYQDFDLQWKQFQTNANATLYYSGNIASYYQQIQWLKSQDIPLSYPIIDTSQAKKIASDLPQRCSSVNFADKLGPVLNQGTYGDCMSFAGSSFLSFKLKQQVSTSYLSDQESHYIEVRDAKGQSAQNEKELLDQGGL